MTKTSYITTSEGENINNYEKVCEQWRLTFLGMDLEELIARFGLKQDAEAVYITYYSDLYRIDRGTGMITLVADPERSLTFNTLMAIYGLFYYSKPDAKVRGEFVPYRLVKRAAPFAPAFQKTVVDLLGQVFDGHSDLLEKVCKEMGGIPQKQGDVGYRINAFDCVPVEIYFWDGDEEFPAQSNILFDADITDFLHEEAVCCIGADAVRVLTEKAGLGKAENLLGDEY